MCWLWTIWMLSFSLGVQWPLFQFHKKKRTILKTTSAQRWIISYWKIINIYGCSGLIRFRREATFTFYCVRPHLIIYLFSAYIEPVCLNNTRVWILLSGWRISGGWDRFSSLFPLVGKCPFSHWSAVNSDQWGKRKKNLYGTRSIRISDGYPSSG